MLTPDYLWCVGRILSAGTVRGTGFFIAVPSERHQNVTWTYLVTADHVIRNQVELSVQIPNAFTGVLGDPLPVQGWWKPLDKIDLAVARNPADRLGVAVRSIHMARQALGHGFQLPPGMMMFYVGIFVPPMTAMVRSGTYAAPPIERKKPGYCYHAALIDCRSYEGFSGSPCFAASMAAITNSDITDKWPHKPPDHAENTAGEPPRYGEIITWAPLAGIFVSHYDLPDDEPMPDRKVSRTGVGVMLPVDYLWEALMSKRWRDDRAAQDDALEQRRGREHPEPTDVAAGQEPDSEYARFEALARQLANTPKPDR